MDRFLRAEDKILDRSLRVEDKIMKAFEKNIRKVEPYVPGEQPQIGRASCRERV